MIQFICQYSYNVTNTCCLIWEFELYLQKWFEVEFPSVLNAKNAISLLALNKCFIHFRFPLMISIKVCELKFKNDKNVENWSVVIVPIEKIIERVYNRDVQYLELFDLLQCISQTNESLHRFVNFESQLLLLGFIFDAKYIINV